MQWLDGLYWLLSCRLCCCILLLSFGEIMIDYECNFKLDDSDKYALVRCPKCHAENYAMNVLSGICTWCGFDINADEVKDD